ncbi:hypothetical protein TD95_003265 [Thielaviopsis punctulata]|uniref:DNA-directed RNA polymerase subunit n=1 Tax=Thielaviopsis punctulata TaxID=72032 RepID=A0A0F4Z8R0_9PEZI|nr:hypothetical protein TD95_003265 [Thielaviopsis punctulata]
MAKSSTTEKKRAREEDAADATTKKQKVTVDSSPVKEKKHKKEKTSKKDKKDKKEKKETSKKSAVKIDSDSDSDLEPAVSHPPADPVQAPAEPASHTQEPTPSADTPLRSIESNPSPTSSAFFKPAFAPAAPEFPLYTQSIALKTPLFPVGFDAPAAAAAKHLLTPMLNRYSSLYRGVLLAYRNVVVAETPSRVGLSAATPAVPIKLQSRDECAVGFAWVSAEVDLFVPAPGAWMRGAVVLQTEGHIGVVCWGKFNASIEASRLPRTWRWVAAEEAQFDADVDADTETASGHWIDGTGARIDGAVLFRVKRFDVGVRDEHSFISIEGSMLSDEEEERTRAEELQREENRRAKASGYLVGRAKRVVDFAVTDCGAQEEEIRDIRSQIDWRRARPPTPTSYSMT